MVLNRAGLSKEWDLLGDHLLKMVAFTEAEH